MTIRRLPTAVLSLTILLLAAGCKGDSLSAVTGKVLVGGKPAVGASVMFYPDGPPDLRAVPGTGVVGSDGTFTLASGTAGGVKPGKYIVTVVWPDPAKKPTDKQLIAGANLNDAPDVLGGRYADRAKSPLRAEVKTGANDLEPFVLK